MKKLFYFLILLSFSILSAFEDDGILQKSEHRFDFHRAYVGRGLFGWPEGGLSYSYIKRERPFGLI